MPIVNRMQNLRSIETRRTLLPPPGSSSDPGWSESWEHLFENYQPAMERYVVGVLRGAGPRAADAEQARDIVQAYFAQALEKGWLRRDEQEIRCFRAYLQTQLRRFTYKHLEHASAKKRSPEGTEPDWALEAVLSSAGDDPAIQDLDEGFVQAALDLALKRLRGGNEVYAEIVLDLLRTDGLGSADLAPRLDRPEQQLPVLRHRAKRRFALLLHEELRLTVRDGEAFETLLNRLEPHLP